MSTPLKFYKKKNHLDLFYIQFLYLLYSFVHSVMIYYGSLKMCDANIYGSNEI